MISVDYPIAWDSRKTKSIQALPLTLLQKLFSIPEITFTNAVKLFFGSMLLLMAATTNAATKTSARTGNWNDATMWSPSGIPANGDVVIIASSHVVTINVNTNDLASLTVNGTLTIGNNTTDRIVTVSGIVTVSSSGVFNTTGNGGNDLFIEGNLINNGTFDMNISGADADVSFTGSANQTISGTGTTTDFNTITINNSGAANNNIVEIVPSNFSAAAGFLILTKGIIKMSGSYTFVNVFFNSTTPTINSDEGLWLNNPNVTVSGQNGDTYLYGLIRVTAGNYNVGIAEDYWLVYFSGAILTMDGGTMNVSGALFGYTNSETINFTQNGGILAICTAGNNYNVPSFGIVATGSVYTITGGTIILQKAASSYFDYINNSSAITLTGGTFQVGNAATAPGSLFWINSPVAFYNLLINSTNNPTAELKANTIVKNDLTIGGVLDASTSNYSINVGHDWINNGSLTPRSGTVTLDGNAAQQIGGSAATSFYNLTVNKSAGAITLNKNTTITGAATFSAGIVNSTVSSLLIFNDDATTTGANNGTIPSYVQGPVKKIGNDAFIFPVGKTGAGYRLCGISAPANATDAFTTEFMRSSATSLGTITASGLHAVSNCEYWKIDRTTGTSNVNVTLSWSGMSICNAAAYVNSLSSLVVAHFNGTNWNSYGANSTTGNASAGTVTWNAVSSFSPFSIGSNSATANPLPVRFSIVKAYADGEHNNIEWTNETEEGLEKYDVERSADGNSFEKINTVRPTNNAGSKMRYAIADASVNNQTLWYRIKAVELNGNIIYSSIVKVKRSLSSDSKIMIYPNPVTGNQFTVQLTSRIKTNYIIEIINQSGQKVFTTNWQYYGGNDSRTISLPSSITTGIYMISLSGDGKIFNSKIIIQ